jgi:hypothetical protein
MMMLGHLQPVILVCYVIISGFDKGCLVSTLIVVRGVFVTVPRGVLEGDHDVDLSLERG